MPDSPVLSYETPPAKQRDLPPLWPIATVMATGISATTFVQLQTLGYLPFQHLLLQDMKLNTIKAATFINIATLPWSLKPIAGLLIDGYPLFGTRRRSYLLLSALVACAIWLFVPLVQKTYRPLMYLMLAMNIAIVFGSTCSGGLLVEAGQRYGASGRLSSLRVAAQNLAAALGSLLGGVLATLALGITALVAIVPLTMLFAATFFLYREPVRATRAEDFWPAIWQQIKNIIFSGRMWAAAALLFFIQAVPGFRNPVQYDYQTKVIGFSDRFLGVMTFIGYGAALLSPLVYTWACRRVSVRISLYIASILAGVSALPYLLYSPITTRTEATFIEMISSFALYLAYMPLFDMAVRATPKGSEALGYSFLICIWNLGMLASNWAGPVLYERSFHRVWSPLVWLNGLVTMLGVAIVFFLPRALVDRREGAA